MNYFNLLKSQTQLKKQIVLSLIPIILLNAIVPLLIVIFEFNPSLELLAVLSVTMLWIIKQIQIGAVPIISVYQPVNKLSAMQVIKILVTALPLVFLIIIGFSVIISIVTVPAYMMQSIALPSMIASTILVIIFIFSLMLVIVAFVNHVLDPSKTLTKHYFENYKQNLKIYSRDLFVFSLLLSSISAITLKLSIPIANPIIAFSGSLLVNLVLTIAGVWFYMTFIEVAARKITGKE